MAVEARVRKLLDQGLYKSADLVCGSFDKDANKTPEQLSLYAEALFGLQQYKRALQAYMKVEQHNIKFSVATTAEALTKAKKKDIREKIGECHLLLGHDKEAINVLESVAHQDRSVQCHVKMGDTFVKLGRTKHAIECYQNAVAMEPLAVEALVSLAKLGVEPLATTAAAATSLSGELKWLSLLIAVHVNMVKFKLRTALDTTKRLLQELPYNVGLFVLKGKIELQMMDSEVAQATLQHARELDMLNVEGIDTLLIIAYEKQLIVQVSEVMNGLFRAGCEENQFEMWIGSALYVAQQEGQTKRALAVIDKALAVDSRHVNALLVKAMLCRKHANELQTEVDADADDESNNKKMKRQQRHEVIKAAVSCCQQAYLIDRSVNVLEGLVEAYLAYEPFEQVKPIVLQVVKEASQAIKNNVRVLTMTGRVLIASGDHQQAAKAFHRALSKDGSYKEALMQLANLYTGAEQYDDAIELLQSYLARGNNNNNSGGDKDGSNNSTALVYATLGHMYAAKGEIGEAYTHYYHALQLRSKYEAAVEGLKLLGDSVGQSNCNSNSRGDESQDEQQEQEQEQRQQDEERQGDEEQHQGDGEEEPDVFETDDDD